MSALADIVDVLAAKDTENVADAEGLLDAGNAGEDLLGDDDRVGHFFAVAQAQVAGVAGRGRVRLAEILDQRLVPADGAAGVAIHIFEVLEHAGQKRAVLGLLGGFPDQGGHAHHVAAGVEQDALRFQTVAPRSPRFLLKVLDRLGHRNVQDKAHVGAIDTHAEGNGGDDDVTAFGGKFVLGGVAFLGGQAGVIRPGVDAALAQAGGEVVHVAAAHAVDDAGLPRMTVEDLQHLLERVVARPDAVGEVGPIEIADEHFRVAQIELGDDILAHLLGGGGSVGVEAGIGDQFTEPGELPILRAEIVAPVADAVGLVDGEGADADLGEIAVEIGLNELLRRDEKEVDLAAAKVLLDGIARGSAQRAIQLRRRDAAGAQAVHLVLHQRDERRHDQGGPAAAHGRCLVAERLAAAGG